MCNVMGMYAAFGTEVVNNVAGTQKPHLHSLGAGTRHTGQYHRTCRHVHYHLFGATSRSQAFTERSTVNHDLMGSQALSGSQLALVKDK